MSRHSVNSGTPKKAIKPPAYCLHKPSGQAVVYLDRRAVYLGPHDSAESWELYWQTVADYADPATRRVASFVTEDAPLSVATLVERYLVHARTQYAEGSERLQLIQSAIRPLLELHASTSATSFGPLALEAVRTHRINLGRIPRKKKKPDDQPTWRPLSRTYINMLMQIIVRIFDWPL